MDLSTERVPDLGEMMEKALCQVPTSQASAILWEHKGELLHLTIKAVQKHEAQGSLPDTGFQSI